VLFATAHLGNWELMGAAVAAELSCPVGVFFRPSYDPRFTRWMEQVRASAGLVSIRVDRPGHLGEAVALLRAGGLLGVMVDLAVERPGVIPIPFLGGMLPSSPLLPILARRTGATVVVGSIRRSAEDPCQHAISIQILDGSSSELLSSATRALEAAILADPIQWTWSLESRRELGAGARSMSRGL
jgi:KDO2-lipid IV(A) lauroyltransferase